VSHDLWLLFNFAIAIYAGWYTVRSWERRHKWGVSFGAVLFIVSIGRVM